MTDSDYPLSGLFLRGRLRHAMTEEDKSVLEGLFGEPVRLNDGARIVSRGEVADRSTLLIDGFIARSITDKSDGHIVGLQVPGDFVDLHAFALKRLDHDVTAIGTVSVVYASHERLTGVMREQPHLARLLWFSTLLDAAIHREWILKLQELRADQRLAHIIVELWHRLEFVGLADPHGFNMPLFQSHLADACGTTAVHINRVIRSLRERGLVEINRGRVTIPDRTALEEFAGFRRDYLYGEGTLAVGTELGPF
ncbi:Crp/Fnr family transcriptional regulator [Novosphingobium marinum]|uniref:CRP-like cAMP-binding protein n=1 Tax=Novosphingobium marinum TaxID=1514948 RepID=A0A7Z0BWA8_9SPHN|nr:Crp/Fnr family transcriptional regulator [Novosphingobium marinum]NYH96052.1 CRP-like cAMP-binding protein [Novosphingobium marinum]GGC32072.1 Crp/Fnr family transcriptional regulator [Novosphingobium marinum]